jgi:hypothetical protein
MEAIKYIEVTRTDGTIQYFETVNTGGYAPVGGGFVIRSFDPTSKVKEIDAMPENYQIGMCGFDGAQYKCVCDPNDRWNGWACPYIFVEDIEKFLQYIKVEEYEKSCIEDGKLKIVNTFPEQESIEYIEKETLLGIEVYNVGDLGWCFDFYPQSLNN